jgi:CSLREA domain-containing protein
MFLKIAVTLVILTASTNWFLPGPEGVKAPTLSVTKTADTNDGICDIDCSLREAILTANSTTGDDTIVLPAGSYVLTIGGSLEDQAASGIWILRTA